MNNIRTNIWLDIGANIYNKIGMKSHNNIVDNIRRNIIIYTSTNIWGNIVKIIDNSLFNCLNPSIQTLKAIQSQIKEQIYE